MTNTTNYLPSELYYFMFMLLENLIFIYFIIKLNNITRRKEKVLHLVGIIGFTLFTFAFEVFQLPSYAIMIVSFSLYPLLMKFIAKKEFPVAIIEFIYLQFIDFFNSMFVAIVMYSLFPESYLRTIPDALIIVLFLIFLFLTSTLFYFTLGKKIFTYIPAATNFYTKNTIRFYTGAVLVLFWFGIFVSLNQALRMLYEIKLDARIMYWVSAIIGILTASVFTVVFILEQRSKYQALSTKTSKDELTGAMNRLFGMEYLNTLVTDKNRSNFTLAFLDINHLKEINDSLGHECGNVYIRHIIDSIRKQLTPTDVIIRHGGDEFLVVSFDNSEQDLILIFEKVINALKVDCPEVLRAFDISFSYGISSYSDTSHYKTLSELIDDADQKMYVYKRNYKGQTSKSTLP